MNLNFAYLEINIKLHKSGFKATCPMFPSCKGIGETQEIATSKLSRSITTILTKKLRDSVDQIVASSVKNLCIKLPVMYELKKSLRKKDAPRDISEIESLLHASGLFEEDDLGLSNDMIPEELMFGFPMSYN
ncbi:MAG: hypothetical protein EXS67_02595 [Candidatus Margulisbacteria bacterium]|nr:hypothetical protein [Candidatus Margulisiibacteriota bacterium]